MDHLITREHVNAKAMNKLALRSGHSSFLVRRAKILGKDRRNYVSGLPWT
jgi:hypothetical protein